MGYSTKFVGKFKITPPLKQEHADYLTLFSQTRREPRDEILASKMEDPVRVAAGLPVGEKGIYFTGGLGFMGQNRDPSILKIPSSPFPGFWCQWVPTENKKNLQWDKGEKFYNYDDWLKFLISHFFNKWGYSLNGFVKWKGESRGDNGVLKLVNNKLIVLEGQERVSFLEEEKIKAKIKKEKKEFERAIPKSTIKKTNTKKTPRI